MTGVAIVTDSTSYLPAELVAEHGIRVVPLQVIIGGTAYDEGAEATSATVAEALRTWSPVTTSRPAPAAFLDAYEAAAEAGCDGIVSIHLSADISGTFESATLAARDSPVPTRGRRLAVTGHGTRFRRRQRRRGCSLGRSVS